MLKTHVTQLRVRYDETDPMGFVHHANYLKYFEIGRTELLRASGGNYRRMEQTGMLVVVVRADCRYHKPAQYDDLLDIQTTIESISDAKIVHQYVVFRDNERLASAKVTMAIVNRDGKVQRIPSWFEPRD